MWSTLSELAGFVCVLVALVALCGVWWAVLVAGLVLILVGWLSGE